jgi:hypothetical protein
MKTGMVAAPSGRSGPRGPRTSCISGDTGDAIVTILNPNFCTVRAHSQANHPPVVRLTNDRLRQTSPPATGANAFVSLAAVTETTETTAIGRTATTTTSPATDGRTS